MGGKETEPSESDRLLIAPKDIRYTNGHGELDHSDGPSSRSRPRSQSTESISRSLARSSSIARSNTKHLLKTESESTHQSPSLWKSSRRQLLILASLFSSNIFSFMCLAIMAPFFPKEAERKYMSASISGWVFAVFSLVQFIFSPIFGMLIPHFGSRFLFLCGTFLAGGCTILFGFLDQVPTTETDNSVFTAFCFTLRIVLALGCTACTTATFAIAAYTFPENASTALGFLETAIGLGLVTGPAMGGFLYEAGGFLVPFLTVGICQIVSVPIYCLILPQNAGGADEESNLSSIPALLRLPVVLLIMIPLIVSALLWVAFDPVLEPFLRKFDLSSSQVGLVFLLLSGTYAFLAPLSGRVADRIDNSTPLIVIGYVVLTVGLLLIGPSPLIGLSWYSELWLVLVSLVILGIGVSLTVVPTYDKVLTAAHDNGFGDTMSTKGAVAGLWTSIYALGEFIGPIYAGAAYEAVGFAWAMTYIAGATAVMFFVTLLLYLYECQKLCTKPKNSKYSPLQSTSDNSKDTQ